MEPLGDFQIRRVSAQADVGCRHHCRNTLAFGVCRRCKVFVLDVDSFPLVCACGGLCQFPLIAEQHVEIAVVPDGRVRRPCTFQTGCDCVVAFAGLERAHPTQTLLGDACGFRLGADKCGVARTVALTECVTACDQRNCFFIVHRHTAERVTDVVGCGLRIGVTVRTFRVHIDQAHLNSGQRVFQIAFTGIAAAFFFRRRQPFGLCAPIDVFFGFPDVFTTTGKTECLEAHAFQRAVTCKDHQVGPADLVAVLLFDRPQQTTRFVKVAVVRPAVQRRKTLGAGTGTAAAISRPVCTGRVPRHTDKERTIVPVVSRPPFLAVCHQRKDVLFQGIVIQRFEFFFVIEILRHRIRQVRVLVKDFQVQLVRPPVAVGTHAESCVAGCRAVHDGAFAAAGDIISVHDDLRIAGKRNSIKDGSPHPRIVGHRACPVEVTVTYQSPSINKSCIF